jgi:hypothetical protein
VEGVEGWEGGGGISGQGLLICGEDRPCHWLLNDVS